MLHYTATQYSIKDAYGLKNSLKGLLYKMCLPFFVSNYIIFGAVKVYFFSLLSDKKIKKREGDN